MRWRVGTAPVDDPSAGRFGYAGVGQGVTITGLNPGRPVTVEVWAVDAAGNVGPGVFQTAGA